MRKLLTILFASVLLISCSNEKNYDIASSDKYEKDKTSLEKTEKNNPEQFLKVTGSTKKNLLRQMVVKGTIYNNAKIVTYKDVAIKIRFFSKTGALLEEDTDVIYESISPGGSSSFKNKYFAPKGSDSLALTIEGAKF